MQFGKIIEGVSGGSAQPEQFGPFYLHELINRGGTAEIWVATNQQRETFALRRLIKCSFFDFKAKSQFFRGCEVLSKIHDHQFVIGYVEHGKIEGIPYLLMEYVEGSNLRQLLSRSDPVLTENVADILIDMAIGIEHVHDSGFMHLDFKPENVLITRAGAVRLIDFDLAQPRPKEPTRMSGNAGTPLYMAPEQLLRRPMDHRAAIFSYGVTAYEILTYRKPFTGDDQDEMMRKHINTSYEIPSPRTFNENIPIALERIIMKCLERDPDERYPFMSIVVRDLQAALYVK